MATVKYAPHILTLRGSVGTGTFSRNRPGAFLRTRVRPRDPRTLQQLFQRARHTSIMDRWHNTLTDGQRIVWNDLGLATTFRSPTCNAFHPTGIMLYMRANVFRLNLVEAPVDVPDPVAAGTPTTLTIGPGADATRPYITADADWHDGKTGHFMTWASPIVSQSIYYWRGPWPWRIGNTILSLDVLPDVIALATGLAVGDRIHLKFKAVYGAAGTVVTWFQHTYWDRLV